MGNIEDVAAGLTVEGQPARCIPDLREELAELEKRVRVLEDIWANVLARLIP